jgi:hypothetical protein
MGVLLDINRFRRMTAGRRMAKQIPLMTRSYSSMTSTFSSITIRIAFFHGTTLKGSKVELSSKVHSIIYNRT